MCQDFRSANVDFRLFFYRSLMEVSSSSLYKPEVPPMIKTNP